LQQVGALVLCAMGAEGFEDRLKEKDVIGRDDFERYRRVLVKFFRMGHESTEFVNDADSHHLLYVTALRPGWFGVGPSEDDPRLRPTQASMEKRLSG
jgi:hypothetical protein